MTCRTIDPPDRCPSLDEVHDALLAALPRGRAWPRIPGSVLWRFWRGVAIAHQWIEARLCAWQSEFWCRSASESLDAWWREYGLPDGCDPFPDLCAKVSAWIGGECSDFQAAAARLGWAIDCAPDATDSVGCMMAGCFEPGYGIGVAEVRIRVWLSLSPAWSGTNHPPMIPGNASPWGAGDVIGCGPDIAPLICLLSRVIPAHVAVTYEVHA